MKGCVIRYTRSTLLISVLHSQIVWGGCACSWTSFLEEGGHSVIQKIARLKKINVKFWIEISDSDFEISNVNEQTRYLSYNNSDNSELCWISTSESWIIFKTKFFLSGKGLRVWFIRKKWLTQSRGALNINKFLKVKSSAIAFSFAWLFHFFNDHFFLFILASVKQTAEPDVLNKTATVLKYAPWQNQCWGREKMITMNETEYLNTCEYGPHYMKMVHTMAPRSNFGLTFSINIQLSYSYNKTEKQASRLSLSQFSRKSLCC